MPCVSLLVSYQVVKAELRIEESMMMTQTTMDSDFYMSTLLSRWHKKSFHHVIISVAED